ncbi:hypothetical protein [Polyangium aurulentum]|uniref:hypothetical protein n=1 Tax=Polyangium aurulentum TaxID=2567896 RepID=UPI0010ADD62B|nr:hypothetical protein [Polyangium aurulentum]UQA58007.1 hypothetical protein E8A73_043185 [Polyangium aurulentum]
MSTSDQDPPSPPKEQDVVMIHSPTDEGDGYNVLRMRESAIEVGQIRSLREGAPVHGDVVKLVPRKEHERLFDVEVLVEGPKKPEIEARGRTGPAQVATDRYRANWDAIFGGSKARGALN